MISRIITIAKETCNGCGLCVKHCCEELGLSMKSAVNFSGKEISLSTVIISPDGQSQ